jgi:uncharacterized protein YkwD
MRVVAFARLLLFASASASACAGQGPPPVSEPASPASAAPSVAPFDPSDPEAPEVTFAPTGTAALRYADASQPVPSTPLGEAVAAVTRDEAVRAGLRAPIADPRLFRACADLAEMVPPAGRDDTEVDPAAIEFALQRNGIIEPDVRLLFGWTDPGEHQRFAGELGPKLREALREAVPARFGVGAAQRQPDGTIAVVFALQSSAIQIRPIPRAIAAGGVVAIDAVIDPGYAEPEVFVATDDGQTRTLVVRSGRRDGFTARMECDDRTGRQQIEIAASDQTGATVLASFPVWCGTDPPRSVTFRPTPEIAVESVEQAEQFLIARVNRERAAIGLLALRWNPRVARVARDRSEEMRQAGAIGHISPTTGTVADRMRAAQIPSRAVLENVARGFGLREAHRGLMNSPGHRANVLSTAVTEIGIGVAFGDQVSGRRELFITEIFMRGATAEFPVDRCTGTAGSPCRAAASARRR